MPEEIPTMKKIAMLILSIGFVDWTLLKQATIPAMTPAADSIQKSAINKVNFLSNFLWPRQNYSVFLRDKSFSFLVISDQLSGSGHCCLEFLESSCLEIFSKIPSIFLRE